jgi:competence protein ComEA
MTKANRHNRVLKGGLVVVTIGIIGTLYQIHMAPTPYSKLIQHARPSEPRHKNVTAKPKRLVHVTGAVHTPGIYDIRKDMRVFQIIKKAGGPSNRANLDGLNLAAKLKDGQRIFVPFKKESNKKTTQKTQRPNNGKLGLNYASPKALISVPGIGPKIAREIVLYRQKNGHFSRIEDLQKIKGIGPQLIKKINKYLTL